MKKNKIIALVLIAFSLLIPLNFGFLSIEEHSNVLNLIMMILIEFAVLGALLFGINKD